MQRRINGNESFHRNWTEYKSEFGSPHEDHWIGKERDFFFILTKFIINLHHFTYFYSTNISSMKTYNDIL